MFSWGAAGGLSVFDFSAGGSASVCTAVAAGFLVGFLLHADDKPTQQHSNAIRTVDLLDMAFSI
jgi:hypothetical protein